MNIVDDYLLQFDFTNSFIFQIYISCYLCQTIEISTQIILHVFVLCIFCKFCICCK